MLRRELFVLTPPHLVSPSQPSPVPFLRSLAVPHHRHFPLPPRSMLVKRSDARALASTATHTFVKLHFPQLLSLLEFLPLNLDEPEDTSGIVERDLLENDQQVKGREDNERARPFLSGIVFFPFGTSPYSQRDKHLRKSVRANHGGAGVVAPCYRAPKMVGFGPKNPVADDRIIMDPGRAARCV